MAKRLFCAMLFVLTAVAHSQNWRFRDTLYVKFDKSVYAKIAKDTVLAIYSQQQKRSLVDDQGGYYVANHYKIDALELISVPVFRISFDAFQHYDGSQPFESFIVFEERFKYQHLIIADGKGQLGSSSIPDYCYEYDRYYNGFDCTTDNKNYYADRLKFSHYRQDSELYRKVKSHPENFYFQIFGLDDFLFDIDPADHKIYAEYIGVLGNPWNGQTREEFDRNAKLLTTRAPLNQYIRENVNREQIQVLALNLISSDFLLPEIQLKAFDHSLPVAKGRTVLLRQ